MKDTGLESFASQYQPQSPAQSWTSMASRGRPEYSSQDWQSAGLFSGQRAKADQLRGDGGGLGQDSPYGTSGPFIPAGQTPPKDPRTGGGLGQDSPYGTSGPFIPAGQAPPKDPRTGGGFLGQDSPYGTSGPFVPEGQLPPVQQPQGQLPQGPVAAHNPQSSALGFQLTGGQQPGDASLGQNSNYRPGAYGRGDASLGVDSAPIYGNAATQAPSSGGLAPSPYGTSGPFIPQATPPTGVKK